MPRRLSQSGAWTGPRLPQAQLQDQRQETDGSEYNDRKRAAEPATIRIDNDESQDPRKGDRRK